MTVNIIKGGIRNVVDRELYERLYKPNGWRIDESAEKAEDFVPVNAFRTETEVRNYAEMRKRIAKKFDDQLFYSDSEEKREWQNTIFN